MPAFVDVVSPPHAIFTVGYRNRFGHPKGGVWERYADAERHRSDRDGAVTFRFWRSGDCSGARARVEATVLAEVVRAKGFALKTSGPHFK